MTALVDLVLGSASPRRADLLRSAGLTFQVVAPDCDETWRPCEPPEAYARRLAGSKAEQVANGRVDVVVLAADTVVWIDENSAPLGKPRDEAEAFSMLSALVSARRHFVTTGWSLLDLRTPSRSSVLAHETTCVHFRRVSASALREVLAAGDWRDKAGAYAIQGRAGSLVEAIDGSYSAVVGLPLAQVLMALEAMP